MFFERVLAAIKANETDEALDLLEELFDRLKPASEASVMMRADLAQIRKNRLDGVQNEAEAFPELRRLHKRMLDLLSMLEDEITELGLRKIKISRESLDRQLRVKLKSVYRIEEKPLREGNTSVIYKGQDLGSRQEVAIRAIKQQNFFNPLMNETSAEALEQDLSRLLGLKHRHLVNILGAHLDAFPACYVEEFVHGPTLDRLMHLGPWPLSRVLPLMKQLGEALYYLHAKGINHGRIRPFKVFLDHEGMATISPFDVISLRSKRWDLKSFQSELMYFSPEELILTSQESTALSDQFCLGVLALTLLMGRPLFGPATAVSPETPGILEAVYLARKTFFSSRRKRLELLRPLKLPARFREIVLQMVSHAPADRFSSMKGVLDALDDLRLPRQTVHQQVQDSYHRACSNHSQLLNSFYEHLFDRYPDIKAHFDNWEKMAGPRKSGALELIVRHAIQLLLVSDPDDRYLDGLRHMPAHAGIGKGQFDQFISCLIEVIESYDFLWDMETAAAWQQVKEITMRQLVPE